MMKKKKEIMARVRIPRTHQFFHLMEHTKNTEVNKNKLPSSLMTK